MPVHLAVAAALVGAGAAESDAIGQQRLEQLPVPRFVGSRHDVAGGVAHRRAIEIEADAGYEVRDVALRQTGVGAARARLDTIETCVDTAAHGLGVSGLFRM